MKSIHDHIIHSKNGVLGNDVTSIDAAKLISKSAFTNEAGIVIHIHGGLVKQTAAEEIAARLISRYEMSNAYPIFFVWESGFMESIRNNLKDILQDKVFQELLKKTSEWVLKKGTSSIATKGTGASVNTEQLRKDFDLWFSGRSIEPPIKEAAPHLDIATKGIGFDEEELTSEILQGIEQDENFEYTISNLAAAIPTSANIHVDLKARNEMLLHPKNTTKGGMAWMAVARFVAKIVIATIRRYANKSDHGAYTTIVEEVLRAAYLDKVGEVVWNQMKKDAGIDAFENEVAAGEVVLQTWKTLIDPAKPLPRITLIGHSTGAIFINSWIKRSQQIIPSLKYDVVLLAPACRSEEFANMISSSKEQINNIRMFAMRDEVEQQDRLVPIIYPRSLLYFVSGVVEGGVDVPILGMQRFTANSQASDDSYLKVVKDYFANGKRAVWSITSDVTGCSSASLSHGDFDNDPSTLDSVSHILKNGF